MFLQQLINGLTLGSIYALIALGYTMVYGILLMINFAHSEIFMCSAYFGYFFYNFFSQINFFGKNPNFAILCVFFMAMLATAFLGVFIERVAYKPLRRAPRLTPLISAIGVSIFLQNLVMLTVSNQSIPYPEIFPVKKFTLYLAEINSLQIFIIFFSIFLMFLLRLFIQYTKLGKAMRAVSQDRETAQLMGINVDLIISLTFFIGAGLGGAAGVLNGMYYGSIKYNMGFLPGIKAFTAAVLGGIGNVTGAMFGGYLLGICEAFGAGYIPGGAEWKDVFAFAILILVLILKPSGILGQRLPERT